jgi:single-strand DNA-binding protein
MINANLLGRLGRDAELRTTPSGTSVLSFALATDSGYGDNKKTVWVDAVIFGKRAESLNGMLLKGSSVLIRGELIPETYQAKDGAEKSKLKMMVDSLEFAGSKPDQQQAPRQAAQSQPARQTPPPSNDGFEDLDIPF